MKKQDASKLPDWRKLFHSPNEQRRACDAMKEISTRALAEVLKPLRVRGALKPGEVGLLCVMRNESARLPLFFEHYKKLGVDRFFMVDNASSDGSAELLLAEPRADIFHTEAPFYESYFGLYWHNGIAQAYCRGNWILMADADELLVYDGMQDHDIKAFAQWLESQGADRAFAPMIDLYTSGAIGSLRRSVSDILAHDSWFDTEGYRTERYPSGWIFIGGPRERLFNTEKRQQPHWISKYPFFRMTDETVMFDNHFLWPWDRKYRGPDAAFLHLKILDDFVDRCAVNEQENQHAYNSNAYRIINRRIKELPLLVAINENSQRYEGPESLIRHGLMLPIDWTVGQPTAATTTSRREPLSSRTHPNWLETLPRSGLVWDRFDDYNQRSDQSIEEHLETVRCRGRLAPGEIGAICVLRNEIKRLPLFFEHYKGLGVDRFFMVDNLSSDGTHDLLLNEPSADVFIAHAPFSEGNYGLFWQNGLARKYCRGNWLSVADADELLVYEGMENRGLADLATWLEAHGQDRLFSIMVDVYPSGQIGAQQRDIADLLVEDCWFDSEGYHLEQNYGGWLVTGGPRPRVFNENLKKLWLSKHPIIYMGESTAIMSHHWLWPVDWRLRKPQSAVVHLKLMDDFIERSATYEREGQHAFGSREYQLINEQLTTMPPLTFFHPASRRYRGPKSLIRYRVMEPFDWNN